MADPADWVKIDARGLRCPWPALRLARALRQGDRRVEIIADDPAAAREIGALAATHGLTVEPFGADGDQGFRLS